MFAHDGLGPGSLALFYGFEHLPVLVLGHDQHVAGAAGVGLRHHKTGGRSKG
jgi:hypothetical protein